MHKKILCLAVCTTLSVTLSAVYANTRPGVCEFGKETVNDITCYGPAKLAETTVKGGVAIAGPLEASNTVMASMQVIGLANLTDSNVKASVSVAGNLNSKHGQFEGDLDIASDKALLNDSIVKGSVTMSSEDKTPVLTLICRTEITGDITFSGKPGVVQKTADSSIEGKVLNGAVEKIVSKEKCPPLPANSTANIPKFCSVHYAYDLVNSLLLQNSSNITMASGMREGH